MSYWKDISIASLDTLEACEGAMDKIECDKNSYTNPSAFWSGAPSMMLTGAENKISATRGYLILILFGY
jgi:hypothetical protein